MAKRRLPVVMEQGLAALKLERMHASEALLSRVGRGEVMCRKGCTHCCHYPVLISIFEGILLYRELQRLGLWNSDLRHALEQHSKKTLDLDATVWLLSSMPCPLLSENQCIAYEARPFFCRMTFSTHDPELCRSVYFSTETFVGHQYESMAFNSRVEAAGKNTRSRTLHRVLPISAAVLLGRHVVESDEELDDLDNSVISELRALA
jgi:Fe-S-cluster containining protein